MLNALALSGQGKEALEVYTNEESPSWPFVFLGTICNGEPLELHRQRVSSRAGRLDEAEQILSRGWPSLPAAERHVDVTRAEKLVPYIMPLAKTNEDAAALYLLWASIYGAAGRWKDPQWVLNQMRRKQVRKEVGSTLRGHNPMPSPQRTCTGS